MSTSPQQKPEPRCTACQRPGRTECGRLQCGNRKPQTAGTHGGNYEPTGSGGLRRFPTSRE